MLKRKNGGNMVRYEIKQLLECLPAVILFAIVSMALLLAGWSVFGGPCRVSLFFNIPGGMITIGGYYVLWMFMFLAFGVETVLIWQRRRCLFANSLFLHHLTVHLCFFLWYPLFFTTLSQILALGVIAAATVLLFVELKWASRMSELLFFLCIFKGVIGGIYTYITLAFLIIN